jgi:hypothetical protein
VVKETRKGMEGKKEEVEQELERLKQMHEDLKSENEQLRVRNEALEESDAPEVSFKNSSGTFTPELTKVVWDLLACHVAFEKIGPVIESCLSLVGKYPKQLPCSRTISNMNISRLAAAQVQLKVGEWGRGKNMI